MKTIKLLTLGLFLSLALIACKSEANTESTVTEEVVEDTPFAKSKSNLQSNFVGLSKAVSGKVTALEANLAGTIDEGAKAAINEELAKYKQFQVNIAAIGDKMANATEDSWDEISEEGKSLTYDIKTAFTNEKLSLEKAGQISNQ